MRRRSVLVGLAATAGAVALVRRRRDSGRVTVLYEDGSRVALERGAPQARRMLALAGEALAAVSV